MTLEELEKLIREAEEAQRKMKMGGQDYYALFGVLQKFNQRITPAVVRELLNRVAK